MKKISEGEFLIFLIDIVKSDFNNRYLKSYGPKQESKHLIYLDANNLCGYAMSKFLPISGFKWIYPKEIDFNKCIYTKSGLKNVFSKLILNILKSSENLAPDKIEISREMLSDYQLKIADLYNIPIGNAKN